MLYILTTLAVAVVLRLFNCLCLIWSQHLALKMLIILIGLNNVSDCIVLAFKLKFALNTDAEHLLSAATGPCWPWEPIQHTHPLILPLDINMAQSQLQIYGFPLAIGLYRVYLYLHFASSIIFISVCSSSCKYFCQLKTYVFLSLWTGRFFPSSTFRSLRRRWGGLHWALQEW